MAKRRMPAEGAAKFIENMNMNGLEGRMLNLRSSTGRNRNILFVYCHHSSLEWWFEYAKQLSKYGNVTAPDLPGFGGMQPLGKIHEKPSLNNLADYLAAFIKLRYKKRSTVTIVGAGFGFAVVTRMLQRYPNIARRVELLVSLNGFTHSDDIKLTRRKRRALIRRTWTTNALPFVTRRLLYNRNSLTNISRKTRLVGKYTLENLLLFNHTVAEDIQLWTINDMRSHELAVRSMLKLDNCTKSLNVPVWHVPFGKSYLNEHNVEQHMRVVFSEFRQLKLRTSKKSKASKKFDFAELLPAKLRRELSKSTQ